MAKSLSAEELNQHMQNLDRLRRNITAMAWNGN